jgi:hypothetical protein
VLIEALPVVAADVLGGNVIDARPRRDWNRTSNLRHPAAALIEPFGALWRSSNWATS